MVKDEFGIKDDEDTERCMVHVLDRMKKITVENFRGKLREDLREIFKEKQVGNLSPSDEYKQRKAIEGLYAICKLDMGRDLVELFDIYNKRCVEETNRLGRILTKDELREIFFCVKENRK